MTATTETKRGRGRPKAFTEAQAKLIRDQYRTGETTLRALAAEHGCSVGTIQSVLRARPGGYE